MMLKKQLSLLLLTLAVVLPVANYAEYTKVPKLTLSAQATLYKPADELQLKIGVVTLGETAKKTLDKNSARMEAVIASLEKAGLSKGDYETGQFSINPTYTPYPKNPPDNWKQSINGYEVSNTLVIHTDKLDMAGELIDVANKAGANSITDIHFSLQNPRLYWTEALNAATSNAIDDAKVMAAAAGVKLVRVLSINLDNTNVISPQVNTAYFSKSMGGDVAPPIEPGEVKITANVTLVYEISSE